MNFPLLKNCIKFGIIYCLILPANAQDIGKSELNAGVGMMASENTFSDLGLLLISALFNEPQDVKVIGAAWSVTYKYHVSERLAVGGSSVFNTHSDQWIPYLFDDNRWRGRSLTTAGEATLYWVKRPGFQLYGSLGGGFFVKRSRFYELQTKTKLGLTFQASPVGLRIGNKAGIFMEMGFGYKGVLNGGMSVRL
jgi:hypothetical protein